MMKHAMEELTRLWLQGCGSAAASELQAATEGYASLNSFGGGLLEDGANGTPTLPVSGEG